MRKIQQLREAVSKQKRRRIALLAGACGVLAATIGVGVSASAHDTVPAAISSTKASTKAKPAQAVNAASVISALPYSGGHLMSADSRGGYLTVTWLGDITSHGGAPLFGSPALSGVHLSKPIVGLATTPDGGGYWAVASDGGVFSYGDAKFYGSTGAMHLNQPIVGMAATQDGDGYWLVAADGGIFTFGDAKFYGSTGAIHLNRPIVGMAATPNADGYWLVASDGGVFSYGDAQFHGTLGGSSNGVLGIVVSPLTLDYTLVNGDGIAVTPTLTPTASATPTSPTAGTPRGTPPKTPSSTTPSTPPTTTTPTPTTTTTPTPTATTPNTPYPVGTPDSSEPSGMAPPAPNALSGYAQSYVNDFTGSSLPAGWTSFTACAGGNPCTQWDASHVVVNGGLLQINTNQDPAYNNEWVSGGVCGCGQSQAYGAYFVRSRVTGAGPAAVELLWPANNSWPPEIDFNETTGVSTGTTSTVHFGAANNQDVRTLSIDMTQWHTWGVIWTPTSVTYTVDGNVWGTVTNPSEIPNIPMTLDFQTATWCGQGWACPSSAQSLDIDWADEYTPN